MANNFTPLDIDESVIQENSAHAKYVNAVLFTVVTLTAVIFAVTISVVLQHNAQAQTTITLPPVEITTETVLH